MEASYKIALLHNFLGILATLEEQNTVRDGFIV